jgi:serine/threonine protein kinase
MVFAISNLKNYYGIQHRDIKPKNILVYKENWYLISDFGSSKFQIDRQKMFEGWSLNKNSIIKTECKKNLKNIENLYKKLTNIYKNSCFC